VEGSCEQNPKVAQIVAAARTIFRMRGFTGATTDMIQRAAGTSKTTIYAYFPTKKDLFIAVIDEEVRSLMRALHFRSGRNAGFAEMLIEYGVHLLEGVLSPDGLAFQRIATAEALRFPLVGRRYFSCCEFAIEQLTHYVEQARQRGELSVKSSRLFAEQFVTALPQQVLLRCLLGVQKPPGAAEIRQIAADAVGLFVRAYGTYETPDRARQIPVSNRSSKVRRRKASKAEQA
jgi:AcrR family transcriptional regulator